MGSSKKHRERGGAEAAEEAPAAAGAAPAGGGSAAGRPREHRKHRHRGGERRGKRSRSRGERSGGGGGSGSGSGGGGGGSASGSSSSRRGGPEEPGRSGHGRGGAEAERRGKRERREEREEPATTPKAAAAESSLSVEETNKLRAKLGLKPLETATVKKEAGTKEDPVAADVINPMVQRQREEIREKLAAAKEKRLLNQKLGKIKTLGEDDPWLDDAAAWIERSRKLQQEKELAEKRAKLLEEMDQEFGVSTLVEEEFMKRKRDLYSSRDLQGLTVEHDLGAFREGETLVLTLKDKGVLEESEDVLVNVTLVAEEQAQENAELRKKKPPYIPYEDEDPPTGPPQGPKEHVVLPKYADPPQRPSFRLGPGGTGGGPQVALGTPDSSPPPPALRPKAWSCPPSAWPPST
ncbi:U4/U6.U5 tri-snRNP-associated protein 1-like [Athene noctua]|uniref:U4/U6.U5 tri-snRNP-associated protein 1-like n=1 Tax=Athene noctua TaxID=126797 RepID=UPI003EBF9B5A